VSGWWLIGLSFGYVISALLHSFGFVRGWLCRFAKSACFFQAVFRVNCVWQILSVALAMSTFGYVGFAIP